MYFEKFKFQAANNKQITKSNFQYFKSFISDISHLNSGLVCHLLFINCHLFNSAHLNHIGAPFLGNGHSGSDDNTVSISYHTVPL